MAGAPAQKPITTRSRSIELMLDESCATCRIYTFKEGLLSVIAHDLKLQVSAFRIRIKTPSRTSPLWQNVEASFDTTSIHAACAIQNGIEAPNVLSPQDLKDIDRNMVNDVLHAEEYPAILFRSTKISGTASALKIKGNLTLCGVTREISLPLRRQKDGWKVEVVLDQRAFGIKPFSALFGAMKVKPKILIRIEAAGLPRPQPADLRTAKSPGRVRLCGKL